MYSIVIVTTQHGVGQPDVTLCNVLVMLTYRKIYPLNEIGNQRHEMNLYNFSFKNTPL